LRRGVCGIGWLRNALRDAGLVVWCACASLDHKTGDRLQLALVKDLKIFFLQIADDASLRVADDNRHQYFGDVDFDSEAMVLRRSRAGESILRVKRKH